MVVVLSILGLASLVAVPGFLRFQHASQLQSAARRTVALAGEARGLAVSGDRVVLLEYDPAAHGLRLREEAPVEPEQPAPGTPTPVGEVRTSDTRLLEYPLDVEVEVQGAGSRIPFTPDGRSEPVTIVFRREGFPPVTLVMNPRTGRLRQEEREQ
jgi:Tfp pilus assembly protein FimT